MKPTDPSHTRLLAEISEHLHTLSAIFHALACHLDHLSRTTAAYPRSLNVHEHIDRTENDPPF